MKFYKRILVFMIILTTLFCTFNVVFADEPESTGTSAGTKTGTKENTKVNTTTGFAPPTSHGGGGPVGAVAGVILGFLQTAAIAIAVGMVFIIGIKYMTKGAGAKAEIKETFLPYLIGAIIVGSASTIIDIIVGWL